MSQPTHEHRPIGVIGEFPASSAAYDACSHVANAQRIVSHFGDQMLFVRGIGWHVWGPPWRHDDLGAMRLVQQLGKVIAAEAGNLEAWGADAGTYERGERQAPRQRLFKWASKSEQAGTISASLTLAQSHLSCCADELDDRPMLLGLPSGVLDLVTGAHRSHHQADRLTKVAGCNFEPDALAPTWDRFISEITGGDDELIDFLGRLMGYSLSALRGEHLLPIFWGSGANGKSTMLGAWQAMLGAYAGPAAPHLLIQHRGNDHPTALADLQGRRLVVVSETGEGGRLAEERVKWLTGGDVVSARRMRQDLYSFKPSHLFVLQTNHCPRTSGTDDGLWRRIRLVPFAVTVPAGRRDPHLPEKLRHELPGILQWAWRGWLRYRESGFNEPQAVKAATATYRDDSDQIGSFTAECCVVAAHCSESAGELYRLYSKWCVENGEHVRSKRNFGMRLAERGFMRYRSSGTHRWRGIGLVDGDSRTPSDLDVDMEASSDPFTTAPCKSRGTSDTSDTSGRAAAAYRAASRGK